jgi:L-ascorbate metabolism protein UlaG (beta-lactamase superfamily)
MNSGTTLKVTRIAHCGVLIDFSGQVVLTDPWFSEKIGYHPGEPVGVKLADLPKLAGVVISHDHYDHNDMRAFSAYSDKDVCIIAESAAAKRAHATGFRNVTALQPWEKSSVGPILVTAVPARHGIPEVGFVLQAFGFTVYFAGDTMLIPELSEIADRFPRLDLALLPINGLRVFGKQVVMDPHEAAELCVRLKPRIAIPTHYAFRGGSITDTLFLKYFANQDSLPGIFQDAMTRRASDTRVEVLAPGIELAVATA